MGGQADRPEIEPASRANVTLRWTTPPRRRQRNREPRRAVSVAPDGARAQVASKPPQRSDRRPTDQRARQGSRPTGQAPAAMAGRELVRAQAGDPLRAAA